MKAMLSLICVRDRKTLLMDFSITLDGELYYGSHFITPLTVDKAEIRGNGLSTFQMYVTITGNIINTIDPESKSQYIIQGDLIAKTRILGLIPLTVTKPLSNYQPGKK